MVITVNKSSKAAIALSIILIFAIAGGSVYIMLFVNKTDNYKFNASDEVFKNPLMGFAPQAASDEEVKDNSLIYVDVFWSELEPSEGVYAYEKIEEDNNLIKWKNAGKHVVFRFLCDYPSTSPHMDIPQWLYDKIGGDGTLYDSDYGKGFSPNYSNKTFIEYHAKAIKALGERFGKDSFFSYIELGSLGHWGEWHVNYEKGITRIPPAVIRREYVMPYVEAFPNAKILMRRPFNIAADLGFGLFDDMAGHPDATGEWLDWIENGGDYSQANEKNALSAMPNQWKIAPIGGEFNSAYTLDWMLRLRADQTTELLRKSHTTFLGPKCPIEAIDGVNAEAAKGINAVLKNMGYRIYVKDAEVKTFKVTKNQLAIKMTWANDGVAPIYWNWPVYLYVIDNKNNEVVNRVLVKIELSKLVPGTTLKTNDVISTQNLDKDGSYKICVGIEDPMTEKPAVFLTMKADRVDYLSVIHEW